MPIRTHRGRAAVYRRLWGWPLRSPKHLIAAVVLLVAAASAVGLALPEPPRTGAREQQRRADERSYDSADRPGTSGTSTDTASPPSITVPTEPPAPAPPDPAGLALVTTWGRQWVNHPPGTSPDEWLNRLRPYTTKEFITVMATVNPSNVPATEVTGSPVPVKSTENSMRVRLPTNGATLRVHVINTADGWRVAGYDKVA